MKLPPGVLLRRFGLTILYALLFVLLSVGSYFFLTRAFTIREIKVMGNNIQVVVREDIFPKTLLFFPGEKIRAELLSGNPILSDVRFEKKYPHTIVIIPTLRAPVALLVTPERRVFLGEGGIVLGDADSTPMGLPVIFETIVGIHVGQTVSDESLRSSLAFMRDIHDTLQMETMTVTEDGVIRAHSGKLDILFTQKSDVRELIATLQTLLAGFRIKGTLPTVIDLRFDKPVVKF